MVAFGTPHRRSRRAGHVVALVVVLAVGALLTIVGCSPSGSPPLGDPAPSTSAAAAETPKSAPTQTIPREEAPMQLLLSTGTTVLTATLIDNATSRDFVAMLPITLELRDYAGTEKISDLPARLSTADAPEGSEPRAGDLTYYAPWGNLAIFYRDFAYSPGLVKLGIIDSGAEHLASLSGTVTIQTGTIGTGTAEPRDAP